MIIVTGTKRSGTSMWMQILKEAGLTLIGEAFPKNWGETLHEANPHGFYESPLRRGVYYATNPHPQNGHYLAPSRTTNAAVKIFIPGLCRSDLAYINRVIGTMRHWREYAASIERMRQMEDEAAEERGNRKFGPPERLDPVLEWWLENFALIRNIVTRQLPAYLTTYEQVVDDPQAVLPPILEWLGAEDIDSGVAAVSPDTRTQDRSRIDRSHDYEQVFDELYEIVQSNEPMTNAFLETMNDTHQALMPRIEEDRKRVMKDQFKRRMGRRQSKGALHPDALEAMVHRDVDHETDGDD